MTHIVNLSRREIRTGGAAAAGLVLGIYAGFRKMPAGPADASARATFEPNVYLMIDETGLVTIVAHRSEMGTGIRTGWPMRVAEHAPILSAYAGSGRFGASNARGGCRACLGRQRERLPGA